MSDTDQVPAADDDVELRAAIYCSACSKRARTYYDKEMHAVNGEGYVTDCGTGGCRFSTGKTRAESRSNFTTLLGGYRL